MRERQTSRALRSINGTALRCSNRAALPRPVHRPGRHREGQELPGQAEALADVWLTNIEADMARGQYIDPRAARTTFREYTKRWIAALTTDLASRAAVKGRLRLHALPYLRTRPIGSFQPEHIRDWNRQLESAVASASYRRLIFDAVSSVLTAAVDDRLLASNPCRARSVKAPRPAPLASIGGQPHKSSPCGPVSLSDTRRWPTSGAVVAFVRRRSSVSRSTTSGTSAGSTSGSK